MTMDRGTLNKPVAMVTWMLLSSGKLQLVILFTFIALIELLLSVSIFVCPCETELKRLYGLSFLIVPAVMLFLAGESIVVERRRTKITICL